jgi:hypothetical protein
MAVDPKKYSLYAQRSAEEQYVNWGKVASDVTKGIYTIGAERQRRKDELDNLTQQSVENLSKIPDVTNRDANGLIIEASDMSKKNLQIQHDLLKRGLITPKDYKLFMSQQQSGYGNMSAAIKQWDGWYQEAMTRELEGNDGKGVNVFESYGNTTVESFGNLKNKMLWTNPANGQVQLVEMGDNGKGQYIIMPDGSENPEKFISPYALNARMNMKDRAPKDLTEEVKKIVDPLAQDITQYIDEKGISTFKEGFRFRGDSAKEEATYDEWLDSQVEALTATNLDMGEILVNQQRGYQIAQSKDDFKRRYCKGDKVIESPGANTSCDNKYIEKYMIKVSYEGAGRQIELNKKQQDLAATITRNAIDNQIDSIVKQDNEPSSTYSPGSGYKTRKEEGQEMLNNLKSVYSATDQQKLDNSLKSIMNLTGLSFDEIDQEIVNGEIVQLKVPFVDENGNSTLIELDLQRKQKVDGKDVYTPIPFAEFAKQAYEYLNLGRGDSKKFVPFSELDFNKNETVTFNPYAKPPYQKQEGDLPPPAKDAVEGGLYQNKKENRSYIFKNGKYVEIYPTDRKFATTTITPYEGRGAVTLGTNVGTAEKANIVGDAIRKIAKDINSPLPDLTYNSTYAKRLRDASATMVKDIGEYLGVPQSVIQGFEPSVDGEDMKFKLPAITLPNGDTIPATTIDLKYEKATEAEIEKTMQNIINHMYPEYAAGEVSSRGTTGDGNMG